MLSVTIIIPVYKKLDLFAESFFNNSKFFDNSQVIIINDDPASENLQIDSRFSIYPKTTFIQNDKNLGFSKSVNKAVKSAKTDLVTLLNTDVFLKDMSWQKALNCFEQDSKLFAISFSQDDGTGNVTGRNRIYFKNGLIHHSTLSISSGTDLLETGWAEGGSAIFRKSMWDELGGFDENFSPFYWEDVDLSYRAKVNGWKVLFSKEVKVLHRHESTIGSFFDKEKVKETAFAHQVYFTKKHASAVQKISLHFFLAKLWLKNTIKKS